MQLRMVEAYKWYCEDGGKANLWRQGFDDSLLWQRKLLLPEAAVQLYRACTRFPSGDRVQLQSGLRMRLICTLGLIAEA